MRKHMDLGYLVAGNDVLRDSIRSDGMNITTTKLIASAVLVVLGMALAGFAFADVLTGESSVTLDNSGAIVAACVAGFAVFHRKLTVHG